MLKKNTFYKMKHYFIFQKGFDKVNLQKQLLGFMDKQTKGNRP